MAPSLKRNEGIEDEMILLRGGVGVLAQSRFGHTQVFVREDGAWKLAASQATRLPVTA